MAFSSNYRESFDDFEGLTNSESFTMIGDSSEMIDFTEYDLDGFDTESIQGLADQINNDLEGMSAGEAEAYLEDTFAEVFPLIPLIAALAPVVAPMVVQGVTSLISNISNRPASPPPPPRQATPPRQTTPARPAPRPVAPTQSPVATTTSTSGSPASSAASLLDLLQNPAVIQAISGIVQSIGGGGNQQAGAVSPQIMDLLLGTVSQLASNTRSELFSESMNSYPDFLFDPNGNLTADPHSPEQMAQLLTQQLASYR